MSSSSQPSVKVAVAPVQRAFWIAFGAGTHVLFPVTVWYLFWFLKGGPATIDQGSLWIDAALSLLFVVPHSILLLPPVRKRLERWIPSPLYGCFFCVVTCVTLLAMIFGWQSSATSIWHLTGVARFVVETFFYASWIGVFYTVGLTGYGYQTGWTPFSHWLRGQPMPRRVFAPRGAYHILRHPTYLSFLGLIWFNPDMTLDHAVLTGIWTAYVFIGSALKDQRLIFFLGDMYREYQARVPGYPLMPAGPLARVPFPHAEETEQAETLVAVSSAKCTVADA